MAKWGKWLFCSLTPFLPKWRCDCDAHFKAISLKEEEKNLSSSTLDAMQQFALSEHSLMRKTKTHWALYPSTFPQDDEPSIFTQKKVFSK